MLVTITRNSKPDLSFIKIYPGEKVVIKPNLVKEGNEEKNINDWEFVITSGKLIALVCEHVAKQLQGKGLISICDAPHTDSSFTKISDLLKLHDIANDISSRYDIAVEVLDLRSEEWIKRGEVIVERKKLPGDPKGTIAVNLGKESLFYKHPGEGHFFGADYDTNELHVHHHDETHEYLICATPIQADVFINMPKLKTHKKTGVTLNLKNLVGINADKNWLPHHTEGSLKNGADQFPISTTKNKLEQISLSIARFFALHLGFFGTFLTRILRKAGELFFGKTSKVIRSGNWYGNNTAWRMVLDLNRCLLYSNSEGKLIKDHKKRFYSVVDGLLGMEGDGPMGGEEVTSNVVISGTDPVAVDAVAARIMGFDWRKIPVIREAFSLKKYPVTAVQPEDIVVASDEPKWNGKFLDIENQDFLSFEPHFGWKHHIEYHRKPS